MAGAVQAGRKIQVKVTAKMFLITKGSSMILALISLLVALADTDWAGGYMDR